MLGHSPNQPNQFFSRFFAVILLIFCFGTLVAIPCGTTTAGTVFDGNGAEAGLDKTKSSIEDSGIITAESIIKVILGWVRFSLPFAGLAAFVGIIYAGFLYVLNFANEEAAGKAKNIIFLCILGLLVIISAYAIVSTVLRATGT